MKPALLPGSLSRLLLFAALALCTMVARPSYAQDRVDPAQPAQVQTAPAGDDAFVTLVIELGAPSAAEVYLAEMEAAVTAASGGEPHAAEMQRIASVTQAQVAAVATQQDALAADFAALDAVEIYRVQRVYNGIAIRLPASQVDALRALPHVRALHPLLRKTSDNAQSIPHIGAPALWAGAARVPLTGEGIRIGIIDTGIDYLHVGLGGPGTGYDANNPNILMDVGGFPNARIVGGYDFAGDQYNPDASGSGIFVPEPDPDPMDCYGHGTHVAASAAGSGVTDAGKEFKGPYGASTWPDGLRIGPGVAPRASIYALKVFGCAGSSSLVDLAIEWAVDPNQDGNFSDHLDVINLSLGSPFGSVEDITTLASERAARIGIIVVASAGNSGEALYSIGSPGIGDRAISVAASVVSKESTYAFGSATDTLAYFSARGVRLGDNALKPDLSAPGIQIISAHAGSGNQAVVMSGTSMAAPMVAGSLALLRELHPDWSVEQLKALVMNTATAALRSTTAYTSTLHPPMRAGAGGIALTTAISATSIAYNQDDTGMVSVSFGAPEVLDTFSALKNVNVLNMSDTDTTYYLEYQPVTDAAGVEILVPELPTVTVAAHATATFPLHMQATAAQMTNVRDETLLVHVLENGHFRSEEAGYLWLWHADGLFDAALSGSTASPPTASPARATFDSRYNPATRALTYTLAASSLNPGMVTGIHLSRGLEGEPTESYAHTIYTRDEDDVAVTLPITGVLQLDPADVPLLASGYLRVVITTFEHPTGAIAGTLVAASPVLKVPVFAAPRAVSSMRASTSVLDFGDAASATRAITLTGAPLTGTVFPTHTQSLVSVFELHARSPVASLNPSNSAAGYSDLRYVGVSSDWNRVANKADARVYFAIATWGKWSTPSQVRFEIRLDVNGDSLDDYRIYSTNAQRLTAISGTSEVFVAAVGDMTRGGTTRADLINTLPAHTRLTALYENDVLFLAVPASLLGLNANRSAFDFSAGAVSQTASAHETGDWLESMRYDMRRTGIQVLNAQTGSPLFVDAPATTIQISYNQVNYARSTAQGVLLLHHHNGEGARAEVVDVRYQWTYNVMMPLIALDAFDTVP